MLKRSMMWMMMLVFVAAPAGLASAAGAEDLHGRWDLKTIEIQGETEEAPEGALVLVFNEDGTMAMIQEGQEADTGRYTVAGDQLTVTTDSDGETESATYSVQGDTFTLSFDAGQGIMLTMTFHRAAAE
jgi:hypothetical protein